MKELVVKEDACKCKIDSDYLINKNLIDSVAAVTRVHYVNNLFTTNKYSKIEEEITERRGIVLDYNILTMSYRAFCMARWQEAPRMS